MAAAIPIVTNAGVYGGIDRAPAANAIWRTTTYDAQSMATAIGTQVNSTTIRPMLNVIMTRQSRNRDHADLLIMSPEHYAAYDAATVAIQRQTNSTSLGQLGFSALEYIGGGKRAEIVLAGGIGTNMPANTTFGIDTDSLRLRYHPQRNFDKVFDGDGQMPIDKDAIAQFIGFMGELTMTNPLFNWRFYDSNAAPCSWLIPMTSSAAKTTRRRWKTSVRSGSRIAAARSGPRWRRARFSKRAFPILRPEKRGRRPQSRRRPHSTDKEDKQCRTESLTMR